MLFTRDGGRHWSPVDFGVAGFIPQQMSFVTAAKGWAIGCITWADQNRENQLVVLHTTDGGRHWQEQFSLGPAEGLGSIDIEFVNATTGWFLTSNLATWSGDLFYTADSGEDWQKINEIRSVRPTPTELDFVSPQVGCIPLDVGAGPVAGGLMFTQDGGESFAVVEEGRIGSVLEVDFVSAQQGWAIGTAPNQEYYLVRTGDGGQTWTQIYPQIRPTLDIAFVDDQHGFGLGQLADPRALLYTADGGDTWQKLPSLAPEFRPAKLSFVDRDTGWVLASSNESSDAVILQTTDGGTTWRPLDGTPPVEVFFTSAFRFFDAANGLMIATDLDLVSFYRTQDGGRTWQTTQFKRSRGSYKFSFVAPGQGWEILPSGPREYTARLRQTRDGVTWQDAGQIGWPVAVYGLEFISQDKGWLLVDGAPLQPESQKCSC